MPNPSDRKPTAFVIMPFDSEFDDLYGDFLYQALTELGFVVSRADDLQNAQNIIKDILSGLRDSDLIVADLTNLNPNVHYELGLAHGFDKPVIMLTQEISRLYRSIYNLIASSTTLRDSRTSLAPRRSSRHSQPDS